MAERVGIDPKSGWRILSFSKRSQAPAWFTLHIWRGLLVSIQLRNASKARMQPLQLAPKIGCPGWYRSNDSEVRARRFSISLQGKSGDKRRRHASHRRVRAPIIPHPMTRDGARQSKGWRLYNVRGKYLVGEVGIEPTPRRFQRPAMTTSATHPFETWRKPVVPIHIQVAPNETLSRRSQHPGWFSFHCLSRSQDSNLRWGFPVCLQNSSLRPLGQNGVIVAVEL